MIAARHAFLLRNTDSAFEGIQINGAYGCKVCSASERGTVRVPSHELETHLAHHRREAVAKRERVTDFLEECE